jgi:hypothetical protein
MLKKSQTADRVTNREQGVALLFVLFALLILTAITASLILMSGTETSVNANYRTEETAFFAAKTGIYEVLDRMQQSNAHSIATNVPTTVPTNTGGVLYLINAGSSLSVVPWDDTNKYYDTELCHEGYSLTGMNSRPPDVPCFSDGSAGTHALPTVTTWHTSVASNYPWSGTSAAMPYEWVRVNWKENKTQSYLSGQTTPTITTYAVNSGQTATTPVCFNGASEVLLNTPTFTSCQQYLSCGTTPPQLGTPVLMITALAVTPNGSRQMVQAEAALNPPSVNPGPCGISDPYGFYAYGNTCAAGNGSPMELGGGGSHALNTDGYNSANGTYLATENPTGGAIGSNGSVWIHGSVNVGGQVYIQNPSSGPSPVCPMDFYSSGGATATGQTGSTPLAVPIVNIPANTSSTDWPPSGHGTPTAPLPGSFYRNVSVTGTLTLTAPGTYNFNCLSVGAQGTLAISPTSKAVTINITGNNCQGGNVIDFNAQAGINNSGGVAANLQFVYPGTGNVNLVGAPSAYAVVIAPKAAVKLGGGTDFFGSILANTIKDSGNVALHFDHALSTIDGTAPSVATATATGSYNILAFRSLPY